MIYGVCTSSSAQATLLSGSAADYVEENVQSFLKPAEPDEAAWQARLAAARACGRPILAANCFLPASLPSVGLAVDRAAIAVWADTACRRAAEAGIRHIVFGSGASRRIPDGFDPGTARSQFVELLAELGPIAVRHGVVLVVEPLNSGECNFITSVDEGAAIVRAAGTPGVRLLADFFHMLRDGEGPESIVRAGDLIRHVHVAERAKRTPPGVDGDDFRPYLAALACIGYAGGISLECGFADMAAQLDPALAELRQQVAGVECVATAG